MLVSPKRSRFQPKGYRIKGVRSHCFGIGDKTWTRFGDGQDLGTPLIVGWWLVAVAKCGVPMFADSLTNKA